MKIRIALFVIIALVFILAACGGGKPEASPTDEPLTIWEYEKVCRQGTVEEATVYEASAETVHPILIFQRDSADTNSYNSVSNTILELPETWMVDYEGDATTVELVVCVTRAPGEFVESCEYEDEKDGSAFILNTHNASYDVRVFAATSGEEIANTTIEVEYGECPMFYMFSDEQEEDTFAYLDGAKLQSFLTQYVEP